MSGLPTWTRSEREWMAQALALGALADGRTSPNPRVGCLVVRDGRVVGRGWHRAPGEPHAEALAIREAGELARGATMFVNLEPCAHEGRTPPCADLLIVSGIRRVVASMQDPNPLVDGRGFARLREAGVEVDVGLLDSDAGRLNAPFVYWHRYRRPLVTLKAALSSDGMLSGEGGASRWITGPAARRFAHRLRLSHDAILVGAGTVRRDDPRLTVRLGGEPQIRRRVILSASLDVSPSAQVFHPGKRGDVPTRVYTSRSAGQSAVERLGDRAEVVRVADGPGGVSIGAVLDDLGRLGVQSLLVEGGAQTLAALLDAVAAQRVVLFYSARLLGGRGGTPLLDRPSVDDPARGWRVVRERVVPLGEDIVVLGRLDAPGDGGGEACSPG